MVAQLKDVHTMSWTEFQKVFGERYLSNTFKEVTPVTVEFQRGGGLNDQKRKLLGHLLPMTARKLGTTLRVDKTSQKMEGVPIV